MNLTGIEKIIKKINEEGKALVVGGAVRDHLNGISPKDIDIEVYGIEGDRLIEILSGFGKVNAVGASFGVLKLTANGLDLDFSLPRRENKVGQGHKGFIVEPDPTMTAKEAAARRDFTMNSLAFDPSTGNVLDFFGGLQDIANGVLRHPTPAFAEDPLRVLRGFQFASRMGMRMHEETTVLCQSLFSEYPNLSIERVWGEWEKWASKGIIPSMGLQVLKDTNWIYLYPELASLIGCEQDNEWHPEGDVWTHTLHTCDAAARIAKRDGLQGDDKVVLVLAALCHDMGKPQTVVNDGRIRNPGHAQAGVPLAQRFLESIGAPQRVIARVLPLVGEHMSHIGISADHRFVRRLAQRIAPASIQELAKVVEADHSGRPPLPGSLPGAMVQILAIAQEIEVASQAPVPLINGRVLIGMGMVPGPQFGILLKAAYDAQLDGAFGTVEDGKKWIAANFC